MVYKFYEIYKTYKIYNNSKSLRLGGFCVCEGDVRLFVEVVDLGFDILTKLGHVGGKGVGGEAGHYDAAKHIEVGVVNLAFGAELVGLRGNPHEELL